jgi:hypothetical protein
VNWYVLHVLTGTESEVQRRLQAEDITAAVLRETVCIRRRGKWAQELRTLFPGYVFLNIELTEDLYYIIRKIPAQSGSCRKAARRYRSFPKTSPRSCITDSIAFCHCPVSVFPAANLRYLAAL